MGLCGDRDWNTGKFMGAHQYTKLLHITQSWTMSWLRKAEWWTNSNHFFALLGKWGWGERKISVTNSCKLLALLISAKKELLRVSQDQLAIVSRRWKPHQKLGPQDFLLICKIRPSVKLIKCVNYMLLGRTRSQTWSWGVEHSVLCVSQGNLHQLLHTVVLGEKAPLQHWTPVFIHGVFASQVTEENTFKTCFCLSVFSLIKLIRLHLFLGEPDQCMFILYSLTSTGALCGVVFWKKIIGCWICHSHKCQTVENVESKELEESVWFHYRTDSITVFSTT